MSIHARIRTASHHVTWFLGTRFPGSIPLVFVVGYPKSGTTWVCQLVADYLQLPFPRFSLLPVGCAAVVHGHERVWKSYRQGVYVLRDGRDAVVSAYFAESAAIPEGDHPPMTRRQRRLFPGLVNKANVRDNIARFVERQMKKPHAARANWADHLRSYYEVKNPNVALMRYEDLLHDGEATFGRAMSELTGEEANLDRVRGALARFSFDKQSKRRPGREGAGFLRKARTGDWKTHFTRAAGQIFDRYCGDMLIQTGYERDHSWIDALPEHTAQTQPAPRAGVVAGR